MEGQFVIIDLKTKSFFKDSEFKIKYFDSEIDACETCGMYELNDVWVMKLIYNHIES
jgi:hypothetical protein